jgi:hypothetical protein
MSANAPIPVYPPLPTDPSSLQRIRQWRKKLPSPSLSRLISPWLIINFSTIALYFILRELISNTQFFGSIFTDSSGDAIPPFEYFAGSQRRETQIFLILLVIMITKFRRTNTYENYILFICIMGKLIILVASFIVHYILFAFFVVLFIVLSLIGPKLPHYQGPTNVQEINFEYFIRNIDFLQEADEDERKKGTTVKASGPADPNETSILLLSSPSVDACTCFESEYARTSLHFGYPGSSIRFYVINTDKNPVLFNRFTIIAPKDSKFLHELPTILMFYKGKLLARLPQMENKNVNMNEVSYRQDICARHMRDQIRFSFCFQCVVVPS